MLLESSKIGDSITKCATFALIALIELLTKENLKSIVFSVDILHSFNHIRKIWLVFVFIYHIICH